jgi:hypothetical protein
MNKQQIELWLFPPSIEYIEDKQEPLSDNKFILFCLLGIAVPTICYIIGGLTK